MSLKKQFCDIYDRDAASPEKAIKTIPMRVWKWFGFNIIGEMQKVKIQGLIKKKMIIKLSVFLMILFMFPLFAFGEIYKWTNDDGTIGFTDDLSKVPEKYRDQVETKKYRSDSPQNDKSDEGTTMSNESTIREESIDEEYQEPEEELSPEEKEKLDKELRDIWEKMKKSLKGK